MKILLSLHHHLDPNQGAAGVTIALGDAFKAAGCEVEYYSFDEAFGKTELSDFDKALNYPWKFHGFLSKHAREFDIIDASSGDSWVWSTFGRPHSKKRHALITRSHGLEHTMYRIVCRDSAADGSKLGRRYRVYDGGFRLWEVTRSFQRADMSLMLNQHDLDFLISDLRVRSDRALLIENGVPSNFLGLPFDPIIPQTLKIANVASYVLRKGVVFTAQAMNRVLATHKNVSITFIGTGWPEEKVHLDYDDSVHSQVHVIQKFKRSELPGLLQGYQIMLFPSLSEGFSLALVEAMACGLAPIATAIPGNIEIAKDNINSILIPSRDSDAIVQAVERLIADPVLLSRLRQESYATAQKYSWAGIAAKTLSIYENVLRKK